jgi:hypothetical protein
MVTGTVPHRTSLLRVTRPWALVNKAERMGQKVPVFLQSETFLLLTRLCEKLTALPDKSGFGYRFFYPILEPIFLCSFSQARVRGTIFYKTAFLNFLFIGNENIFIKILRKIDKVPYSALWIWISKIRKFLADPDPS